MKTPQCNRAFAEVLAASVERSERKEFERDWGEMRHVEMSRDTYFMAPDGFYKNGKRISEPLRQPRLHQSNFDSAFILAIFLAIVAVILCSVR